ncbi:MAG: hypothetical protein WCF03_08660 [Nitrososphaeraceae archaeon]
MEASMLAHIENKHDEICNNPIERMFAGFQPDGRAWLNTFCGMHFNHYRPFAVKMENIKRKGIDINKWLIEKPANEKE